MDVQEEVMKKALIDGAISVSVWKSLGYLGI
jgi:hypothetical protein